MRKKTAVQQTIDKLLWVMATQSNKDVIHGINIAIVHLEDVLETEREQIEEAYTKGHEKGWYDFKSNHGIMSNMKPDKFRVDLFHKEHYKDTYE